MLIGRGIGRGGDVAAPATRSRGGARRSLVTRSMPRSERREAGSGKSLVPRRCFGAAWPGLRCGGAAWPRRRGRGGAGLCSERRGCGVAAARFGAARGGRVRRKRKAGVFKGEVPRISEGVYGRESPKITAVISARSLRAS